jgi:glucose-1-phosphate thymidylyltransferase
MGGPAVKPGPLNRCWSMEIAKAVILAGRTAHDRPWPSVKSGPKHLVPIANQPIIFHNLESLRRAGVLEATIAVDPESAGPTKAAVGDGSRWGLAVRYVGWLPRTGICSALAASRDFIADEPVLVEPADALHREHIHPHIAAFARERLDAMALRLASVARGLGGAPLDGAYLLSRRAVAILLDSPRTLSDPMDGVREHGGLVRVQRIDGCLPCHGGQDRLLEGNRRMLETMAPSPECRTFPSCELQGPVFVHPTATLEHTLVRGPAMIGPRSRLSHAYVGPYTSIGADVRIDGSQIEHSIVLERAELLHVGVRLDSSVIGRGARIDRSFGLTSAMRLSIGDGAEVTFS